MLIRAGLHPHTAHASMLYRAAPCTTSSDYYVVTIKVLSAARQRFPAGRNSISTCAVFRQIRFGIFDKAHMRLPRRGVNLALYAAGAAAAYRATVLPAGSHAWRR